MPELALEVHICAERRSYKAVFTGPDADAQAARFIEGRSSTHAFFFWVEQGQEYPDVELEAFPLVTAILLPICEHGMSGILCAGPMHYPSDDQY